MTVMLLPRFGRSRRRRMRASTDARMFVERVVQVHVRRVGGEVGVARRDRRGDEPVLGDGCREPVGVVAREPPHPDEVGADGPQRGGEVVVADGGVERRVEAGDERVVGVEPGLAVEARARELVGERGEGRGIPSLGGEPRGGLFERAAHLEELADVVGVDIGDDGDPRRLLRDEPVGGEPAERLAQRRAAHAEARRLLDLAEHGAGRRGCPAGSRRGASRRRDHSLACRTSSLVDSVSLYT